MTIRPKVAKPSKADERDAYELVTLRDNDTCQRCRRNCGGGVTSRHHRKNRSAGGLTVVSNLVVLGGTGTTGCHGEVTEHPEDAVRDGWAVPGWPRAEWREWPAARWVRHPVGYLELVWVLYDDEGEWTVIDEWSARGLMVTMGWSE